MKIFCCVAFRSLYKIPFSIVYHCLTAGSGKNFSRRCFIDDSFFSLRCIQRMQKCKAKFCFIFQYLFSFFRA